MTYEDSVKYLNFAINYLHWQIKDLQNDMSTFPYLLLVHKGMKQAEMGRNYLLENKKWDENCKEIIPRIQHGISESHNNFNKDMFKYHTFK